MKVDTDTRNKDKTHTVSHKIRRYSISQNPELKTVNRSRTLPSRVHGARVDSNRIPLLSTTINPPKHIRNESPKCAPEMQSAQVSIWWCHYDLDHGSDFRDYCTWRHGKLNWIAVSLSVLPSFITADSLYFNFICSHRKCDQKWFRMMPSY
jgi:hypothetical protein